MYQNCLVNIPKYSKHCMYRYGELTFSYSFLSVWTHKLRFLAKLLHIPKRAKNVEQLYCISIFKKLVMYRRHVHYEPEKNYLYLEENVVHRTKLRRLPKNTWPLNVSFWRYREFRTWKKSRNSVKFRGISRNYTTRNSAEFRRNFNQFRTEYGIDGSKKNRRNSVSTEFRGHPSSTASLHYFTFTTMD